MKRKPTPYQERMGADAENFYAELHPELERNPKSKGWYDFRTFHGGRWWYIDVKWTDAVARGKRPIRLIRKAPVERWCDVYVLIWGSPRRPFEVKGWAWGSDLASHWDKTLPYPGYAMPLDQLYRGDPIKELRRLEELGVTIKEPEDWYPPLRAVK